MLKGIGKIVASARKRLRVNVQALARKASVDGAKLVALEKGLPGMTTTELARVAEQLELDPAALLLGRDERRPRTSIFLKHQGSQDFDYEAERVLDDALEAGRSLRFLNKTLGCTPAPRLWDRLKLSAPGRDPAFEGYEIANKLRRQLKWPNEPLPDLGELLEERFEIVVVVQALRSDKMTAVSVRDHDGAAAVILNAIDPHRCSNPLLDRVYLAHELGHIMSDASDGGLHIVIDREEEKRPARTGVERGEQRARAFAAEFLMPLAALMDLFGTPGSTQSESQGRKMVSQVRNHFSTPWQIAANHLNHRGFISDSLREILYREGSKDAPISTVRTRLPDVGRCSVALANRARAANQEGLITDGQARVATAWPVEDPLPWDDTVPRV